MHKVLGNQAQTLGCCQQMHLLGELAFQFGQLRGIQFACLFQGGGNLIVDFWILQVLQFLTTILIIEGHGGFILYGPFEVIDTYVATECTRCNIVV